MRLANIHELTYLYTKLLNEQKYVHVNKQNVLQLNYQDLRICLILISSNCQKTSQEVTKILESGNTASTCSQTKLFELVSYTLLSSSEK